LRVQSLLAGTPQAALHLLRVMLDPDRAAGIDLHIALDLGDGRRAGLHIRNSVSVATDGEGASETVHITWPDLANVLGGGGTLAALLDSGRASITGDAPGVRAALASFDAPGLQG
jgi:alkyl sulfatase BDS1-like metallo-beta-lactamase superfamily hydrolase